VRARALALSVRRAKLYAEQVPVAGSSNASCAGHPGTGRCADDGPRYVPVPSGSLTPAHASLPAGPSTVRSKAVSAMDVIRGGEAREGRLVPAGCFRARPSA